MIDSASPSNRWRKLHNLCVWGFVGSWAVLVGTLLAFPGLEAPTATAIALGTAAFIPHFWLGLRIWHDTRRTGIGIPIALISLRLLVSLILFSVILWHFPDDRRIVAWSGSIVVIVFSSIEAFVFAKGVGRL